MTERTVKAATVTLRDLLAWGQAHPNAAVELAYFPPEFNLLGRQPVAVYYTEPPEPVVEPPTSTAFVVGQTVYATSRYALLCGGCSGVFRGARGVIEHITEDERTEYLVRLDSDVCWWFWTEQLSATKPRSAPEIDDDLPF